MEKVALIKTELISTVNASAVMPLGVLQLAAVLRQKGIEARVLDLQITPPRRVRAELEKIVAWAPDLVGLSSISMQREVAESAAEFFRRRLPRARIVAGGPLASSEQADLLRHPAFDFSVCGEGEEALPALIQALRGDGEFSAVSGLSWRDNGVIRTNETFVLSTSLDELPFTAWDLVDLDRYGRFLSQSMRLSKYAAVFTSRGCPFHCTYCHNIFGKKFRARSPDNVMAELRLLYEKYGVRRLEIIDDIFNLQYGRAFEILSRMKTETPGMSVSFPNGLRADALDEKMIELIASIPCDLLIIPVETGSLRLQKMIRKNLDVEKAKEVIRLTHKHGIHTWAFFMVGFPTETEEELRLTFDIARMEECDYPVIAAVCPYEGTELQKSITVAIPSKRQYDYYYGDFTLSALDPERVNRMKYDLMRRRLFYRRRNWYIMSNFMRWKIRWLGPLRMLAHIASIFVDAFAKEKVYSVKYLLAERQGIFDRLRRSLQ